MYTLLTQQYTPCGCRWPDPTQLTQGEGIVSQNFELAPEARLKQHLGNNRTGTSIILLKETLIDL